MSSKSADDNLDTWAADLSPTETALLPCVSAKIPAFFSAMQVGATGFEPATSASRTCGLSVRIYGHTVLTDTPSSVCTRVCTSMPESGLHPLEALAAAVLALTPTDRAKLLAMLTV